MKRGWFLSGLGLAGPIATLGAGKITHEHAANANISIRGVRASVAAFKNSRGEVVGALDEHGNLGIRGAIRSVEINGPV